MIAILNEVKHFLQQKIVNIYDDVQEADDILERIDIPFNDDGIDPYGISRNHIKAAFPAAKWVYRKYFRVKSIGIENIPDEGRVMLVGNHSGGLPIDGSMIVCSVILDHDPPRFAIGMVDKFAQRMPIVSSLFARVGQVTGLRDQAERLLSEERILMVFPEGSKGVGKLYKDRYNMVEFTNGFMRLALKTNSPIVPFAFVGGEEAIPTIFHANALGKMVGAPYFPVTPYILPIPRRVKCQILYGEPMVFESDGSYKDIQDKVEIVKSKVNDLILQGLENRKKEGKE